MQYRNLGCARKSSNLLKWIHKYILWYIGDEHLRTQYILQKGISTKTHCFAKGAAGKQIDILHVAIKFDCT